MHGITPTLIASQLFQDLLLNAPLPLSPDTPWRIQVRSPMFGVAANVRVPIVPSPRIRSAPRISAALLDQCCGDRKCVRRPKGTNEWPLVLVSIKKTRD